LRTPDNLNRLGTVWRVVLPLVSRQIADVPQSHFNFEKLVAPESIAEIRAKAAGSAPAAKPAKVAAVGEAFYESPLAATTQWMIADAAGNVVCCTQSESLHFGAGVVAPGTGVVLNDSMSNFSYAEPKSLNYIAPGKRPRSTIGPTIAFRAGKPAFAMGIPGAARIPTAMLQALLDRIVFARPMADAIGDTRVHYASPLRQDERETFEAEKSLPAATVEGLRAKGWRVELPEEPGRGRHFGGINAIEFNADGTLTGYPDPRRTNAAAGY
jgi:gamma-glutamyltranspeptidase/glutathione hydrolase